MSTPGWKSYDSVADDYERSATRWFRPLAEELVDRLGPSPDMPVLDVGTGTGLVLRIVRERVGAGSRLIGVDPSAGMLARLPSHVGARVLRAKAPGLPLPSASVSVTCSNLSLSHVSDPRAALQDMARVTRPGGLIAFTAWAPPCGDSDEFRDEVQPLLAEVAAEAGVDREPPESAAPWEERLRDISFLRTITTEVSDIVEIEKVSQRNWLTMDDLLSGWSGRDRYRRSTVTSATWDRFVALARQRLEARVGDGVTSSDDFWIAALRL